MLQSPGTVIDASFRKFSQVFGKSSRESGLPVMYVYVCMCIGGGPHGQGGRQVPRYVPSSSSYIVVVLLRRRRRRAVASAYPPASTLAVGGMCGILSIAVIETTVEGVVMRCWAPHKFVSDSATRRAGGVLYSTISTLLYIMIHRARSSTLCTTI
ncbi:hypothetical protein BZA05DRAFT_405882 [Tricharina praecox]|uniref:uncharacterized protein n=1 Tax=Tricharina praecox TaxID=43433 RepID=UPI00221EDA8F|nr:uncharacterized protein BZA05DRAFT_405882 [Tricharina praecox]KAI5846925.1 hypothetical protein BZA05DRAFT_405882 [Tricharina praecox]